MTAVRANAAAIDGARGCRSKKSSKLIGGHLVEAVLPAHGAGAEKIVCLTKPCAPRRRGQVRALFRQPGKSQRSPEVLAQHREVPSGASLAEGARQAESSVGIC